MDQKIVVTIDGPAGAGKSTAARLLARKLGYVYIDSGALYRAIAWLFLKRGLNNMSHVNPKLEEDILNEVADKSKFQITNDPEGRIKILYEELDISLLIRKSDVEKVVPHIALRSSVRSHVVTSLRAIARNSNLVIEGRDMGTIVFPEARVKFFMVASPVARAQRRYLELRGQNVFKWLAECLKDIEIRDQMDTNREVAPLRPAQDAIVIDTTNLAITEVVQSMLNHLRSKYPQVAESVQFDLTDIAQQCILIAISGPIGVGKTTLSSWLSEKLNIPVFRENPDENPFIVQYYSDRMVWAFPSQMWFLWRKHELLNAIREQRTPAIIDRTLHEDYMFAKILLQQNEINLYEQWYRMVFSKAPDPDLIISLEASAPALYERVRERGRNYELGISVDFLESLHKEYIDWISEFSDCPKVRINTETEDPRSAQVREGISVLVHNLLQVKTGS